MTEHGIPHPPIVGRDDWRAARVALLAREKELTRARDALNAARRRLPMVRLDQDYRFTGPDGAAPFAALFAGRRQLIVYHFMFDPRWDDGCPTCTGFVNGFSGLDTLARRDTTLALVSRAPYPKLAAYRERQGWTIPWYSSFGSDFNFDFQATYDAAHTPHEHNYRPVTIPAADLPAESQGLSVFFRLGADVYHTYSTYGRGVEGLANASSFLDVTPYGRQEAWEDAPPGWPRGE